MSSFTAAASSPGPPSLLLLPAQVGRPQGRIGRIESESGASEAVQGFSGSN